MFLSQLFMAAESEIESSVATYDMKPYESIESSDSDESHPAIKWNVESSLG